ncbi:fatty acid cis/trans isomerase [Desulfoluna butyratoxydans]|uniref:Fatty acid cis-trans isomerase n=1 Tax=Desulfoluna butyratoxydans TaxID=231438 RepID=A0A4U8YQI9_9BACT|nr:fatty acid cis/trans isomerase [Desulfoluna butyratoxydans]VFQ45707.1 fatty acid cis-trans isomerase [Desulfoluna butyratoxydans]
MGKQWKALLLCVGLFLIGCGVQQAKVFNDRYGPEQVVSRVDGEPRTGLTYYEDIRPILEKRCSACHSCYDAPCQLKLTSFEGVDRGATSLMVYNASRITADDPTRLFIDADTTPGWRDRGFHPVLNERTQEPSVNRENSVLARMLELKAKNPQPKKELLPQSFDLSLAKANNCEPSESFDSFEERYPLWGMPYALPGLTREEHDAILKWIADGGLMRQPETTSPQAADIIARWELFFNGTSLREQLVSRYIYEHLFIAHIHFEGLPSREFYRLVRSTTPPGEPVDEIPSVRPYDAPGIRPFYYRLKKTPAVVVKDHTVYRLSDTKMRRFNDLFFSPAYEVSSLPSFDPNTAANPLRAFAQLPAASRYRFLLDDAHFFVNGFIKGPVCRGQVALNVINDHFFVAFFDPDKDMISNDSDFLAEVSPLLALPGEKENTLNILSIWFTYSRNQKKYLKTKDDYIDRLHPDHIGNDITHIWDGDGGTNDNALLTVFRHFDSATVLKGLVGQVPKTAWVVDFPLLERIHYLLVAGFDVYGNVGHQAVTRLYMDFLRMEGENNFLSFMPSNRREEMRKDWYQGTRADLKNHLENPLLGLSRETGVTYGTQAPKDEFFEQVLAHVGPVIPQQDPINRCPSGHCPTEGDTPQRLAVEKSLRRITAIKGRKTEVFPDVSFLRVVTPPNQEDLAYTIIKNKALSNNSFMFGEERRRRPEDDTLSIVRGHVGSYPNAFVRIDVDKVDTLANRYLKVKDEVTYYLMARRHVVRRTSPDFWDEYDWHCRTFLNAHPVEGGTFDLYRYIRIAEKEDGTLVEW